MYATTKHGFKYEIINIEDITEPSGYFYKQYTLKQLTSNMINTKVLLVKDVDLYKYYKLEE